METRTRIHVTGIVQGVGFRPFVYGLAKKYNLRGFCRNNSEGVVIEVEGEGVKDFIREMRSSAPPLSKIETFETEELPPEHRFRDFRIEESRPIEGRFTLISPDTATCPDCLRELFDPADRRYLYPFINCTNCGPRYSIVLDIPYDRDKTTMAGFRMCALCSKEYHDPLDRRFHAQPDACAECGPKAWLIKKGEALEHEGAPVNAEAVSAAAKLLKDGAIVAVKGLGGFHLACDASNDRAVKLLRERKRGSNKPFALMAPDADTIKTFCRVNAAEEKALLDKTRPIVLLEKKPGASISDYVSPENNYYGCMLPYTPLHHMLFKVSGIRFTALVMTSGNLSEEPIVISNEEALEKLSHIADHFLLHNRPIYMRVDDSIVRAKERGRGARLIRRARGFTPVPIDMGEEMEEILATGGELKNTFCITKGRYAIMSQHIGDMENYSALGFFKETLKNLKKTFRSDPRYVACDMHPDYMTTKFAEEYFEGIEHPEKDLIRVQHHHAHIAGVMAEHGLVNTVIGVAFDGTGYGTDGNIWGGEFFIATRAGFHRAAHLKYIPLPGGDKAVKEPWRTALSFLYDAFGDDLFKVFPAFFKRFDDKKVRIIMEMIRKGLNCPLTSSSGRLFDAVSSILGIRDVITFEAEAAIELETRAGTDIHGVEKERPYPFDIIEGGTIVVDTAPVIKGVVDDIRKGVYTELISKRFHHTVARIIQSVALRLKDGTGLNELVLSGGVFQNRLLLALTERLLEEDGFRVLTNEKVPLNDGSIALGQAAVAWERIKNRKEGAQETNDVSRNTRKGG